MVWIDPQIERIVAHLPEVVNRVSAELDERAARVEAVVTAHTKTGDLASSLKVERNRTDSTVSIADPWVVAINYGHKAVNGRWVEGIHAIEAAL
ncbi:MULTISPECIES: DUF5403 family protein [unclassified Streptomyces]|uniref:DUF5403 family protein n=1 Tax=unclassified Streptomyces TaxID=2593676 RepID=UPI0035DDD9F2